MATYLKSKRFLSAVWVAFFIMSCSNQGNNLPKNNVNGPAVNGVLYKLFADSAKIASLDTFKVVFVPRLTPVGVLELDGWSARKDTFQVGSDITLSSYDTTYVPFSSGMYIGNVVLKKKDLADLKVALNTKHMHYVLFIPRIINNTHFGYSLELTNDNPGDAVNKVTNTTVTGQSINPSPPKTY